MTDTADEDLTALLDGQLEGPERAETIRRLASDPDLQDRFDALARTRGPLDSAFAQMLAEAPVARLRAAIPSRPSSGRRLMAGRGLAASFVVVALLSAAAAAWVTARLTQVPETWTTAVVDYMQLYTAETFADLSPDAAQGAALIEKVGARMGVSLPPRVLAAPGLSFKTAFVLSYDGDPLGEFVFADAAGRPYLFCILAEAAGSESLHRETRPGYTVAVWGRGDKRFLVIGPSEDVVGGWLGRLQGRV